MEQKQSPDLPIWQIALPLSVSEKAMNAYGSEAMTQLPGVCQFGTSLLF